MMNGDSIDARESKGFINKPTGSVTQVHGQQRHVETKGNYTELHLNFFQNGSNSDSDSDFVLVPEVERLAQVLKQPSITDGMVQKAYRTVLPEEWFVHRPKASNLSEVLAQLQEVPRRGSGRAGPIQAFIAHLVANEELPAPVCEALQGLSKQLVSRYGQTPPVADLDESKKTRSYLLVQLRPDKFTDQLLAKAWLIPDDTVEDPYQRFNVLDVDEQQNEVPCTIEEMEELLKEVIDRCLEELMEQETELTIEFFLPRDHLCHAVSEWKSVLDFDDNEFPIGTEYRVVVRSYERLSRRYRRRTMPLWRKKWKMVCHHAALHEAFELFAQADRYPWEMLRAKLRQLRKVGLIMTCAPFVYGVPQTKKKDVFSAILSTGTPIALWPKRNVPTEGLADEIKALLVSGSLLDLPCQNVCDKNGWRPLAAERQSISVVIWRCYWKTQID